MKKIILLLLFIPLVSFGQMDYYVSAKGGLNVREAPNSKSKKVATLLYGQNVTIESETGVKLTVNDTDKKTGITKVIEGEWVKIEYSKSFFNEPGEGEITEDPLSKKKYNGYVFDGFLEETSFPKYIKENYVNLNSMDNLYVPKGETRNFTFKGDNKPKRLTNCYKYKSGIPFSGIAYDIVFSDQLFKIDNIYGDGSPKYIDGPGINIYVADFKNGIMTGKVKRINPLEEIEKETLKIIESESLGIEKEIIVKYISVEIEYGDLDEYIEVNGSVFFDISGNSITDFPSFNFWVNNGEAFFFNKGYENKFLKITYFSEYIEPKGEHGYEYTFKPIHFFDLDCNLNDIVKKVEIIENFNVKP